MIVGRSSRKVCAALAFLVLLSACTAEPVDTTIAESSTTSSPPAASTTIEATPTTSTTTTTLPPVEVDRIGVRIVDGAGEFYNTATNETFVSRGVNYLDFRSVAGAGIADSVFAVSLYDRAKVQEAFRTLASFGYNTARIFYDICDRGPDCLVGEDGGWSDAYLDNIADTMRIAAREGVHLILTANSIPVDSRWQETYDVIFGGEMNGLIHNLNGYWLHEAGIAARVEMFTDLLAGLETREVPFEIVLGWQLQNELWLDPTREPFTLTDGVVSRSTGDYDLASDTERRAMVADAIEEFVNRMREVLAEVDPEGLITVGFFSPAVSNDWAYVDTESIIDSADVDFWDFHAYHDTYETLEEQAEAFGMIGYETKPIVMGETGGGKDVIPTGVANVTATHRWMAEACELGFDGWLNWGYYPWPDGLGGAAWAFLDDDGLLMEWASPSRQPDMCVPAPDAPRDLAADATITASRTLDGEEPGAVVDGSRRAWNAGDFPPQWIRLAFDEPTTVSAIYLAVEQWPPSETRHRVWGELANGTEILLGELEGFTDPEMVLSIELDSPVESVTAVRIETLASDAWVAWEEISILPG